MNILSNDTKIKFIEIVGEKGALDEQKSISPYLKEERNIYHGKSPLVLLPSCVNEVSKILKLATATKTAITPQGGNTGLVGGQIPREDENDIVLSLERINSIRDIDLIGNTISVDAGISLLETKNLAKNHNRFFPLSLPSEKSCQIGGNIATNAGGSSVLFYGNMRQLCLGIEAVLPNGEIWNGMTKLIKDNSCYDIKNLFIGSEGTLGIITGATLKLFPYPNIKKVAFIAVESIEQALELFQLSKNIAHNMLTAFELISKSILELVIKHIPNHFFPLKSRYPWYILLELSNTDTIEIANNTANTILSKGFKNGIINEWILSSSSIEKNAIWHLRNSIPSAQKKEGRSIKHDISVPIKEIPSFLAETTNRVLYNFPKTRIGLFGHMGDGNIHFNVFPPADEDQDKFLSRHWDEINDIVYSTVLSYGGSIAAEHGIGQLHKKRLKRILKPTELKIMQNIKKIFDPAGIMNPGKFF
ncbi:FAD-binding oxidoreductase [Candidatus Liberibacter americanus]|uniref:FAD/FMN-containing dehydrogenase n=1 Tax=Candidatus Liberibacter americanus str. Sao Paulo TaxID=1261131 RepID=U6B3P9_9HYPH|nr:FAD-binding oxidoreductase [Candidatus Liberibacter americanus]AHA27570.1 FAD/FMN-containing dehydrogenase [Candidatus Liberibacter americanus str. Sao Paulo]EMS36468.1 FAD-dependent oxidoreductase protein [Candidatus Liberibacter americanus PW_SP]